MRIRGEKEKVVQPCDLEKEEQEIFVIHELLKEDRIGETNGK